MYLAPLDKTLPEHNRKALSEENANSAYTYYCKKKNKIVVFREEEWFKVLLHETFHYLKMEYLDDHNLKLKQLFPIASDILLGEAYCEFWARILNNVYIAHLNRLLYMERMFSCYQAVKVLHFMGLQYRNIIYHNDVDILKRKQYREETNIFAYYVITALFMHCYDKIIVWCHQHNHSLFAFDNRNMNLFVVLVEKCRDDPSLLININTLENYIQTSKKLNETSTMRMSLLDFL